MSRMPTITVTVNNITRERVVEARTSLADFLRDELGLNATHLGCEQGACGACTVLIDGATARSCITLAVQADGSAVTTVEGIADDRGDLHALQRAFAEHHALQCGFCTPGFLLTAIELLATDRGLNEQEVREAIAGNLCRCTGYGGIVDAILAADETWDRADAERFLATVPREPATGDGAA